MRRSRSPGLPPAVDVKVMALPPPPLTLAAPQNRGDSVRDPPWAAVPHPRPGTCWYVEVVRGEREQQKVVSRHAIERAVTIIGRHPAMAHILASHDSVSRQHTAILWHKANKEWMVADLASAKGSFLDGERAEPFRCYPISEKSRIIIGESARQYYVKLMPEGQEQAESEPPAKKPRLDTPAAKDEIQCAHILVKYAGSRNPSTWRGETVSRSRDEALAVLEALRTRLTQGESFEELALAHSDCSSAKRGGDLGPFSRGKMQPSFEDAAFKLAVGDMTSPIWTDSGVHLIRRLK